MDGLELGMMLLNLGNVIVLFGTVMLIVTVYRNMDVLKGYNLFGSYLTFTGLLLFMFAYIAFQNWISLVVAFPTLLLWGMISFYNTRRKLNGPKGI